MSTRHMELILDDADFDTIQAEITHRQVRSRAICPNSPTLLPDGESNLAGAIVAEMVRDLNEYRGLRESDRRAALPPEVVRELVAVCRDVLATAEALERPDSENQRIYLGKCHVDALRAVLAKIGEAT